MTKDNTIRLSVVTRDLEATIIMPGDEVLEEFLKNLAHIARLAGYDYVRSLEVGE